jgi:N-acetylmuramoyl-L-alanine amidase
MKKITNIVVHQTGSAFGTANLVRQWHIEKGYKGIGYHFLILNGWVSPSSRFTPLDGSIEVGRPLDADAFISESEIGAHTLGLNDSSIGLCIVSAGGDQKVAPKGLVPDSMTKAQFVALVGLVGSLQVQFGIESKNVIGHYETMSGAKQGKSCPGFNMEWFRKNYLKIG